MLTILLTGGLLVLLVIALIVWPLLTPERSGTEADREVAIYEDQLAEIERDQARNVLNEEQATAARTEVERRLLGALKRREDRADHKASRAGRLAVIAFLAGIPLLASLLYLQLGAPEPSQAAVSTKEQIAPQIAGDRLVAEQRHPELDQQMAALETRLTENPDDIEGYALLARSYARLGEYEKALSAYRSANQISGGREARIAGEMAEVMVITNDGIVGDDARLIFENINTDFPDDPQSSYYLALAKAQNGDVDEAVEDLRALRVASPADAPWVPTVDALLAELAPSSLSSPDADRRFAGPSAEQIAAAQQLSSDQQAQMIEGMVSGLAARLEDNPDDLEGWKRLAGAYEVLGRMEDAEAAHRQVISRNPDDAQAKRFLSERGTAQ